MPLERLKTHVQHRPVGHPTQEHRLKPMLLVERQEPAGQDAGATKLVDGAVEDLGDLLDFGD